MEYTNEWIRKGERKGKLQGKREGKREGLGEGRLAIVLRLLHGRFDPIPVSVVEAVGALPASRLDQLADVAAWVRGSSLTELRN